MQATLEWEDRSRPATFDAGFRVEVNLGDGRHVEVQIMLDDDRGVYDGPREWDNLGTMVCWHRHYNLGDEQPKVTPDEYLEDLVREFTGAGRAIDFWDDGGFWSEDYGGWGQPDFPESVAEFLGRARITVIENYLAREVPVMLPLFLYDHSGITMNTTGFPCPWDSGQVGFIYVTAEQVRAEYGDLSPASIELARKCLVAEVEVYDQHLRGEVYGYTIEIDGEHQDGCWGYYGDPGGYLVGEINRTLKAMDVDLEISL